MDLSRFYPPSLMDQSFGFCITPQDLIFPSYNIHGTNYYRPWKWYLQRSEKDFGSTINNEKNKFEILLDVQHFQPSEINVKVSKNEVIIEGKHEERQDNHGIISRQFRRRYFLPTDCNENTVISSLSSDGVLTVTADKTLERKTKEIIVPIKMCETCPNKDLVKNKMEKPQKEKLESTEKLDSETRNKHMEIMLKEDHCCLLKPELLGAMSTAATQKTSMETKKDVGDFLKTSVDTLGATSATATQNVSVETKTEDDLIKATAEESRKATSTESKLDVAFGHSTISKADIAATSTAAKSEICNIKSTLQESTTIHESSTSTTSMASSIEETSQKISVIVNDISAQLKEAAENI